MATRAPSRIIPTNSFFTTPPSSGSQLKANDFRRTTESDRDAFALGCGNDERGENPGDETK